MREGWELRATRHMKRRLNIVVPAMFAGAVAVLLVMITFFDWHVGLATSGTILFLTIVALLAVYAIARRGLHSASKLFGPSVVWDLDAETRKAALTRIRKGQPAPDAARAVLDVRVAERADSGRWPALPLAGLLLVTIPVTSTTLPVLILNLGLLVWLGRVLLAARRSIAANRARWSD